MTVRGVCREPRCVGPVLLHSIHLPCAIIGRGLSKSIYATVAAGDTTGQAWQAGRPAAASSAASGGEQRGQWRRAGHTATVELGPVRGGAGRSLAVGEIGVGGLARYGLRRRGACRRVLCVDSRAQKDFSASLPIDSADLYDAADKNKTQLGFRGGSSSERMTKMILLSLVRAMSKDAPHRRTALELLQSNTCFVSQ